MGRVTNRFLAFDLGAESGRAILGTAPARGADHHRGLPFSRTSRCATPASSIGTWRGCGWRCSAALDRLTGPSLDSIGVDTWGCDYALLGEQGNLLENPFSYRDTRTDGVMQAVNDRVGAQRRLRRDRHPVPARSTRSTSCTPPAARRRGSIDGGAVRWRRSPTCSTSGCRASCSPSTPTRRPPRWWMRGPEAGRPACSSRSICRRGCSCR